MRTAWIRVSLSLVTFVLLTTSIEVQGQYSWHCEGCVSKVIQLPNSSTPPEMQDVTNMFRVIVELRILSQDTSQHTISITCTPDELAVVEKLVTALEDLRTTGDQRRSILVYEPQNPPPSDESSQAPGKWVRPPELAFSFIKALYLPNSSAEQMQSLVNTLRTSAQVTRIQMLPSAHVVVVRGTSKQVAQAESLMNK